ncbi:MAG: Smr/MutS family protein [Gemmatimonadaceae bacterium]|nr:Smr/MutS family protein [Gemmatimonadaceae bacterium]
MVHRGKPQLTSLWHALDEAAFGTERTLNLRELLPSAAEARARTDVWLRARQVTKAQEVLVITGRGNQSIGGIGVVRQEILNMLPSLRRRGVVESWREHSPGSIVVKMAPLSSMLTPPQRKRDNIDTERASPGGSLIGLQPETLVLLRQLAIQNLESLGVIETEQFVEEEMTRTFSALARAIPAGADRERLLCNAILKAIDEIVE